VERKREFEGRFLLRFAFDLYVLVSLMWPLRIFCALNVHLELAKAELHISKAV
jgi:hypothetical protein